MLILSLPSGPHNVKKRYRYVGSSCNVIGFMPWVLRCNEETLRGPQQCTGSILSQHFIRRHLHVSRYHHRTGTWELWTRQHPWRTWGHLGKIRHRIRVVVARICEYQTPASNHSRPGECLSPGDGARRGFAAIWRTA